MVKNHLKTIAAPKTWPVKRKSKVFILRPSPGKHNLNTSISLNFLLINMLNLAKTKREATYIAQSKEVLIDGKKRIDISFAVGLFDVITIKDIKKNYRLIIDNKGKFCVLEIDAKEALIKPCKIIGKTMVNKKIQLNLFDGENILTDKKDFKVGDSVVLSDGKIKENLKLEKGYTIYLTGGKHIGQIGTIEDVMGNKIIYKKGSNEVFETLKKYAFVIGKDKPVIKIEK